MADLEHVSAELFHHVQTHTPFDLLVPMKNESWLQKQLRAIPAERFTRRWAGFATLKQPYRMAKREAGDLFQFVQRSGERSDDYHFGAFLCTADGEEVDTLTRDYPKRWHVEEFFSGCSPLILDGKLRSDKYLASILARNVCKHSVNPWLHVGEGRNRRFVAGHTGPR